MRCPTLAESRFWWIPHLPSVFGRVRASAIRILAKNAFTGPISAIVTALTMLVYLYTPATVWERTGLIGVRQS
jgi:hypothetical protein